MRWHWQKWSKPEWIHLLLSATGVRAARTWNVNEFVAAGVVLCAGIIYELLCYVFTFNDEKPSITDVIADALGCSIGLFL